MREHRSADSKYQIKCAFFELSFEVLFHTDNRIKACSAYWVRILLVTFFWFPEMEILTTVISLILGEALEVIYL